MAEVADNQILWARPPVQRKVEVQAKDGDFPCKFRFLPSVQMARHNG
jgi:hypothetical protein